MYYVRTVRGPIRIGSPWTDRSGETGCHLMSQGRGGVVAWDSRGGRTFPWRRKSRCLVSECLLGRLSQWDPDRPWSRLTFHASALL